MKFDYVVYTDGSKSLTTEDAYSGFIIKGKDFNTSQFYRNNGSISYCELEAIREALKKIRYMQLFLKLDKLRVEVITDSLTARDLLDEKYFYNKVKESVGGVLYNRKGRMSYQEVIKEIFVYRDEIGTVVVRHINSHINEDKLKDAYKNFLKFNVLEDYDYYRFVDHAINNQTVDTHLLSLQMKNKFG